jgi:hypothetical protein
MPMYHRSDQFVAIQNIGGNDIEDLAGDSGC